jgi:hypothetical protein
MIGRTLDDVVFGFCSSATAKVLLDPHETVVCSNQAAGLIVSHASPNITDTERLFPRSIATEKRRKNVQKRIPVFTS